MQASLSILRFLTIQAIYVLGNFLYKCTWQNPDLNPRKVGYFALSIWLVDILALTWFTEVFPLIVTMLFFTTAFHY